MVKIFLNRLLSFVKGIVGIHLTAFLFLIELLEHIIQFYSLLLFQLVLQIKLLVFKVLFLLLLS